MEKLDNSLFEKIIDKYNFFLSDINVNITKNLSLNRVYFDPEVTVTTVVVPNEYYDMKNEVYRVIKEQTNLTPVLRAGWKIHWSQREKLLSKPQKY
jgi:hypothetical protein